MPLEGLDYFYIPEFDSPVITTAHQSLALVRTKINAPDRAFMPLEGEDFLAC